MTPASEPRDRIAEAARQAAARDRAGQADREPSLGARLGQIGVLGWMMVLPILLGLLLGRWLDRLAGSGVLFSAAFLLLGAVIGFWSGWKWMHRS